MPHSNTVFLPITKLASFNIRVLVWSCVALTREGSNVTKAGKKLMANNHATITPIAEVLPRSRKGGASLKFSVIKPIAVVNEVRNTGVKLMRKLSRIAVILSSPKRIRCIQFDKICTQSATAIVSTITGADIMGEVKGNPIKPAEPSAVTMENKMTIKVTNVPAKPRNNRSTMSKIAINAIGIRCCMSYCEASGKALLSITTPVK